MLLFTRCSAYVQHIFIQKPTFTISACNVVSLGKQVLFLSFVGKHVKAKDTTQNERQFNR